MLVRQERLSPSGSPGTAVPIGQRHRAVDQRDRVRAALRHPPGAGLVRMSRYSRKHCRPRPRRGGPACSLDRVLSWTVEAPGPGDLGGLFSFRPPCGRAAHRADGHPAGVMCAHAANCHSAAGTERADMIIVASVRQAARWRGCLLLRPSPRRPARQRAGERRAPMFFEQAVGLAFLAALTPAAALVPAPISAPPALG
jgi:hypothetical protein